MAMLLLMLFSMMGQIWVAVANGAWIFIIMALLVGLLAIPVLALITATPRLILDDEGIRLEPIVWPRQFVAWQDVLRMEDYPLLPEPDQEVLRRAFLGRKRYRPAEGKMLIVRGLPPQYRAAGLLAGVRGEPIIVVTNRSYADYDALVQTLERRLADQVALDRVSSASTN